MNNNNYTKLLSRSESSLSPLELALSELQGITTSNNLNGGQEAQQPSANGYLPCLSACTQALYYPFIFGLGVISSIVYIYLARTGAERYKDVAEFIWIASIAAVVTNVLFNSLAFLELGENFKLPRSSREVAGMIVAVITSAATNAPTFFVGLKNAKTFDEKVFTYIAGMLGIFVYYQGALDFYKYFHAAFIQKTRWAFLRGGICRPESTAGEKYRLVQQKSDVLNKLKGFYLWYIYAPKEKRETVINEYAIQQNFTSQIQCLIDERNCQIRYSSWKTRELCSGTGFLWGTAVIAQNFGHIVETIIGFSAFLSPVMDKHLAITLACFAGLANLVPGLGFTFAGMLQFDFYELLVLMTGCRRPQVQRVLVGDSYPFAALLFVTLLAIRGAYCLSGFGNDEVNYEGTQDTVTSLKIPKNENFLEIFSMIFGLMSNAAGAIVFNGAHCELLIQDMSELFILYSSLYSEEDKRQIKFGRGVRHMIKDLEVTPTDDFQKYSTFFSQSEKKNAMEEAELQNIF